MNRNEAIDEAIKSIEFEVDTSQRLEKILLLTKESVENTRDFMVKKLAAIEVLKGMQDAD